jgi:nucleotide-binding universal stress UspA family protein
MKDFGRIIWAADPLEDKSMQGQSIHVLRDLSKKTGATIEPVYVLSDGLLSLSIPKADLVKQFKPASERALNALVKKGKISKVSAPKVIVAAPASRGAAVEALDRYAQGKKADLILVNSHGRRGLKRAVMGSFAETLTLHAKTPVLISGPKTKHITKLDHIVFPTDFSRESRKAYEKALELAKKLDAKVTIFYAVLNTIDPIIQSSTALLGGGFVTTRGYVRQIYDKQRKQANQWVADAKTRGVVAEAKFDDDSTSVVDSVLRFAKKSKAGIIAMASKSGAVSAALLGSVGRGIARDAPCPVWFLRA